MHRRSQVEICGTDGALLAHTEVRYSPPVQNAAQGMCGALHEKNHPREVSPSVARAQCETICVRPVGVEVTRGAPSEVTQLKRTDASEFQPDEGREAGGEGIDAHPAFEAKRFIAAEIDRLSSAAHREGQDEVCEV